MSKPALALFDFDGTITTKDTLLEFIIHTHGRRSFWRGIMVLSPVLFLFKAKIIPNWKAKELMLSYFFRGMDYGEFEKKCSSFAADVVPSLIRKQAMEKIDSHLRLGDRVVIVSASPENWVKKWADAHGLECLATRMQVTGGAITGKFSGKNCHGPEKVERIKCHINLADFNEIHAYGDSQGDKPMMKLATASYYKPFRSGGV